MYQLSDFEALLIMRERTPITKNLIDNLSDLKFVITSGLRNRSVDLEAAKKRKIIVCGTDININPTPELTWALILGLISAARWTRSAISSFGTLASLSAKPMLSATDICGYSA